MNYVLLQDQMTEANNMNEQERHSLLSATAQKIQYLQSLHEAHLTLVIQGRQSVINEINETHRKVIHDMDQTHRDLINEMNETHQQAVETHRSETNELNESHRLAIDELNQSLRETGKFDTLSCHTTVIAIPLIAFHYLPYPTPPHSTPPHLCHFVPPS